ncbi:MAG TPA: hypothetical protein VG871_18145 [Vicinamibacterales bacterium]|nr:hypothetical protein [Vicinamibacterales bacterium]
MRKILVAIACASLSVVAVRAQPPAKTSYTPPKTAWGDPDLTGIWPSTDMVGVPFERPKEMGTRAVVTDAEFAARQKQDSQRSSAELEEFVSKDEAPRGDGTGPPSHWLEWGKASHQASLVVDPPDGRLPPSTPEAQRRAATITNTYVKLDGFNSWTELGPYDRCISRGPLGSIMPVIYNNGNQIFQFPGYVVIRYEMIHEVRVIPLDGRPHVSPKIRGYMGDPRGHWEGNTLVVETTNLNGRTGAQGNGNLLMMSDQATVVERFTRTGPDTLQYEVTVTDPGTWTRPWTASFPLRRDMSYGMFEYACHEGNHAMSNVLSASRAEDRTLERATAR